MKELVAKVKFWFGEGIEDVFNDKYIVERTDGYAYIYRRDGSES